MPKLDNKGVRYMRRPFSERIMDFLSIVSLILFTLRLVGVIDIPIWKVFIPIAVPYVVSTLAGLLIGIGQAVSNSANSHKE